MLKKITIANHNLRDLPNNKMLKKTSSKRTLILKTTTAMPHLNKITAAILNQTTISQD